MKKAALVVGARPQFIKIAPLIIEMGRFFETILIHTGQHYDIVMSDNIFKELRLPRPDYHLSSGQGSPGKQTGRMIEGLETVFDFEKPDFTVVVGDTNSTLAGAIASAKLRIPIVHLEAGVRSKDKFLPEQVNRVVTDSISDLFLCPDSIAVDNLKSEGKTEKVFNTGDIIYDCLRMHQKKILSRPANPSGLPEKYVLATLHRADAVDNELNFESILRSLGTSPHTVVFPIHPRSRKMIKGYSLESRLPDNILICDPVGYIDLLSLITSAEYIVTDSGGVQRESAFLGKPVIIARNETEWRELENAGSIFVKGYDFNLSGQVFAYAADGEILKHITRPSAVEMVNIINSEI